MGLDDIVIPALTNTLGGIVGNGAKTVRVVRYGEQLSVAQAPECWIINASGNFPEKQGSDLEQTDWSINLRILYPYAIDQTQPEIVLGALIEPFRQLFRAHLHMGTTPSTTAPYIARARIMSATWGWTVINLVVYRFVDLRLAVREKSNAQFQA
jgi:hypothetical protein